MSVRVSTSRLLNSACSGLMYSGVPIITPWAVCSVRSVSGWCIALASPKSITFGTGWPSYRQTRMLLGFRSRWMTPLVWACWTAWQTGTKSARRSAMLRRASSQYWVKGTPLTYSMTKKGRPLSVVPPSSTLAMFGWSIRARACRSASNRARTVLESIPALMSFRATLRRTGCVCSATQTVPMPPSPISSSSL